MPFYATICQEPRIAYKGAADGSRSSSNTTILANTDRTELQGFNGNDIAVVVRNKSGDGTATPAGATIQVETTGQDKGAVTDFSSPVDFLFDCSGIDDADVMSFKINGAPGQKWRVLSAATKNIQVEIQEMVPSR